MHLVNNGGGRTFANLTKTRPVHCNFVQTIEPDQVPYTLTTDHTGGNGINVPYIYQDPSVIDIQPPWQPEPWTSPYTWPVQTGTGAATNGESPEPEPLTFEDIRISPNVKLSFDDISTEEYRTYHYADGSTVTYMNPIALAVTKGGHRLITADGECHYILSTWQRISWKVSDDEFHFVK